jgi:hypothetical protein
MLRFLQRIPLVPKLLLEAFLIMLLPLNFTINQVNNILYFPSAGFLLSSWEPYVYIMFPSTEYFIVPSINQVLTNLALGLLLAAPSISFSYRISKIPANKPIRNLALGVILFSSFVTFITLMIVSSTGSIYYYPYVLIQNIQMFPTLAICFFIILPMVQRQAILIATPEELHSETMRDLERNPDFKVLREKALASILWACLCFAPFFLTISIYGGYAVMLSLTYQFTLSSGDVFSIYSRLNIVAIPIFTLAVYAILSSIRFVYIRDIYRYLRHEIGYGRLLFAGILGDAFPVIVVIAMMEFIAFGVPISLNVFPMPALFFAGLLILKLHRSVLPYANQIWHDVRARMWFEDQTEQLPVRHAYEESVQITDETVKVPIHYMISSKIRRKLRNNRTEESKQTE